MELRLDPQAIRSHMTLRRAATDIKLPMDERLKVHFITRRAELLSNFSLTAGAWMVLLHACVVNDQDNAALERLKTEILDFKTWAEDGLQELQRMGLQETIASHEDTMPDDPALVAAMRKMLGIPPPKDPRDSTRS